MGKGFIFKLDKAGVRELLCSAEMQAVCQNYADAAAARCGEGYVSHPVIYPERHGAAVAAATIKAVNDNGKNNTILKAVHE